jgi:hypothetical protein
VSAAPFLLLRRGVAPAGAVPRFLFSALLALFFAGAATAEATGQASLYVGSAAAPPSGSTEIEVLMNTSGGAVVAGIQFDLVWDPSRALLVGVEAGEAVAGAGKDLVWRSLSDGAVRVIVMPGSGSGDGAIPPGTLAVIRLSIPPSAAAGVVPLVPDNVSATNSLAEPVTVVAFSGNLTVTSGLMTGCCARIVAAAANAGGVGGSRWKSRLLLENSATEAIEVRAFFLRSGADNSHATGVPISLAAGEVVTVPDAVNTLFGVSDSSGAIAIDSDSDLVRVTSRTYNEGSACAGTFGQGIPAISLAGTFSGSQIAHLFPVASDHASFRSNLGIVNVSPVSATFVARLLDAKGIEKARREIPVSAWSYLQVTDVLGGWSATLAGGDGRILLSTATSGVSFTAYLSVVDNGSGDPAYFPALP